MRCPYCGGLNPDRASFCAHCGRDFSKTSTPSAAQNQNTRRQSQRPSPPEQPGYQPPYPPPSPPYLPPSPPVPPGGRPALPVTPQKAPGATARPVQPAQPTTIEPPAPFPPRTIEHLKQLEQGALSYVVLSEAVEAGRKKIVSIMYERCVPWQQVATLLRALQEQAIPNVDTLVVQGFLNKESDAYRFTNGYLQFDRNVRLGSQTQNRYQIETGNGFDADSIRIVLSE